MCSREYMSVHDTKSYSRLWEGGGNGKAEQKETALL